MEPAKVVEGLFDKKRVTVLKLFLDNPDYEYGVREAAKSARLAPATVLRILRKLLALDIVSERRIKKLRLYKLAQSRQAKFLDELLAVKKTAIEVFVEKVREITGIEAIILYGKPQKDRADIHLIGEGVDPSAVSLCVGEIKERYKFSILHLILNHTQYEQMTRMGILGGEKQTLFERK